MKSLATAEELAAYTTSKRWTVRRKCEAVLRLLRGESLDELSRQLQVPAHRLAQWLIERLGFRAPVEARVDRKAKVLVC